MAIQLKIAQSSSEKDQIYQLRHRVFVEEEERFEEASGRVYDHFDTFGEAINILALDEGVPIGSIRVILENPVGIPAIEHFDFRPFLETLKEPYACVGWLCTLKKYRRHPGVIMGLFKTAVREMRKTKARHIIATIHPPLMSLLRKSFGAKELADAFFSEALQVEMLPVHIDIDNFPPGSREPFEDPDNLVLQESHERRIYRRNEVIYSAGQKSNEAFLVMRGAVRILPPEVHADDQSVRAKNPVRISSNDFLLGKGEVFGELALIDETDHSTSVLGFSNEVDVMVWPKDDILNQLKKEPQKAFNVLRILTKRLRRQMQGLPEDINEAFCGRVLLDASQEGAQPVKLEWLSRQCAVWPDTLGALVDTWTNANIVNFDAKKKSINIKSLKDFINYCSDKDKLYDTHI